MQLTSSKKYDIIYADPPWKYRGKKQFNFVDARDHYPTMPVDDICDLPVPTICAADSLLYLWVTGPMMQDGLAVMNAWGFDYATIAFVWNKVRTNPGYYTLSQTELVLAGKRGRIPHPRGVRNARQWLEDEDFTTDTYEECRGRHSAKPKEVRDRITLMHPTQEKIELFARERVPGWDAWGNDVGDHDQPDSVR